MQLKKVYLKFHVWRLKQISQRNFILLLSVFIGLFSGVLAVSIKNIVSFIRDLLNNFSKLFQFDFVLVFYPIIGIVLTYFVVKVLLKMPLPRGIPEILERVSLRSGKITSYQGLTAFLGSVLTVSFGGSVGLEAPAAQSASAFSFNLGALFKLNHRTKMLMIGCAAAATLSAIFNAPIAAVVFALEVFMLDLTTASIIPLLLSSATAFLTTHFFIEEEISFQYNLNQVFNVNSLPQIILLAICLGFFSAFYNKIYFKLTAWFKDVQSVFIRWLIGGFVLGGLVFLFPSLYGEGYDFINQILSGNDLEFWLLKDLNVEESFLVFSLFMLVLVFFKAIASIVTLQIGGVGGIFAPALFMGSALGFVLSKIFNHFNIYTNTGQMSLLGMTGLVSGLLHAPLTGIFLIAEITGGYKLFLPLMLISSIAFLISKYYEKNSIYQKILKEKGRYYGQGKDEMVIDKINFDKLIETDLHTISISGFLPDLIPIIKVSKRNIFPVIDEENNFVGIIHLDDVRTMIFDLEKYSSVPVRDLVRDPSAICDKSISATDLMQLFKKSGAWSIVITNEGKYIGLVSRSKMFQVYRNTLIEYSN